MAQHWIASVDAGNGFTTAIGKPDGGKVVSFSFPSVRSSATGYALNIAGIAENKYVWADWLDGRYVVGDNVMSVSSLVERHISDMRSGGEFHQFLVAYALARLGVRDGDTVDLTIFTPPGLYAANAGTVPAQFKNATIALEGDVRTWKYTKCTLLPESVAAAYAWLLTDEGMGISQEMIQEIFGGRVVVLDGGVLTLDATEFTHASLDANKLQTSTFTDGGIDAHLRKPILAAAKARAGRDFQMATVDHVDLSLRSVDADGRYWLRVNSFAHDISDLVKANEFKFANWIANNIIDGELGNLRGVRAVIIVGGLTRLEKGLAEMYPDRILLRSKYAHVKKIHPVEMNAVGGFRFALMKANRANAKKGA